MSHLSLYLSKPSSFLLLIVLLLAGCGTFSTDFKPAYSDPYGMTDFDELLGFGANMTHMTDSGRAEMCRSLLARQQANSAPGLTLHRMVGRLLSDDCGDIGRILNELAVMPPGVLGDFRMQQFVAINTEALKRMDGLSKRMALSQRKQKSCPSVGNAKSSKRSKSAKKEELTTPQDNDEAQLLREKLEAIRSMEKQLDESSDGN